MLQLLHLSLIPFPKALDWRHEDRLGSVHLLDSAVQTCWTTSAHSRERIPSSALSELGLLQPPPQAVLHLG